MYLKIGQRQRYKTEYLKGEFTQKWKFCHLLLTLRSFKTHKTFVHLDNTNAKCTNAVAYTETTDFTFIGKQKPCC